MSRNEPLGALINLQMGFLRSACLYVVAKLEVADQLTDGERTSDEIARRVKANPEYLYRVMRLLASDGVFEEKSNRVFALTPTSDLLRIETTGREDKLRLPRFPVGLSVDALLTIGDKKSDQRRESLLRCKGLGGLALCCHSSHHP